MHLLQLETRTKVFRSYTDTSHVKKTMVKLYSCEAILVFSSECHIFYF